MGRCRVHVLDYPFLEAKIRATGPESLDEDYERLLTSEDKRAAPGNRYGLALSMVQSAIRLSAHVLRQNGSELASQLFGRLQGFGILEIQHLLRSAKLWKVSPWLRPLTSSLIQPAGRLLRTLTHDAGASPSLLHWMRHSRVWNLTTGRADHTIAGHNRSVTAVAVTPDGTRVVSGSSDGTLNVWDLITRQEEYALAGHDESTAETGEDIFFNDQINVVIVTPDGKRAVSASQDQTVKVWDLTTGQEERTFAGHDGPVKPVAVTPDGRYVISGTGESYRRQAEKLMRDSTDSFRLSDDGPGMSYMITAPIDAHELQALNKDFPKDLIEEIVRCQQPDGRTGPVSEEIFRCSRYCIPCLTHKLSVADSYPVCHGALGIFTTVRLPSMDFVLHADR